jgi:hypothetical protein
LPELLAPALAAVLQSAPSQASEIDLQNQQLPLRAGMDIDGSHSSTLAMTLARKAPIGSMGSAQSNHVLSEST